MRTTLTLTAALTGALAGLAANALPALADSRETVMAGAAHCAAIADPRLWLDCYYGAAQPMRAQLGLSPAPASQTRLVTEQMGAVSGGIATASATPAASPPVPPPWGARDNSDGGGIMKAVRGGQIMVRGVPLTSYRFDRDGFFTLTFSDGEVWRQLPDDDSKAHWTRPASTYVMTIKQAWFGSHELQVSGDDARYKVRRIQ